jgi:pimeloyl-ACP methyl ester carboxylesterase
MIKGILNIAFLVSLCACVSSQPSKMTNTFLSETLSHPQKFESIEAPSRYWSFDKYLVHFISNVNEKNKNQIPIIYVHGLGGSLDDFAELIEVSQRSKFSHPYYAIDLPPFGKSVMEKSDLSIQGYADLLQEFISTLEVPRVSLVCHSMGGQVCIEFALRNPNQVQLLTLVSPAGVYDKTSYVNATLGHYVGIGVGEVDHPNASTISDLYWYSQSFTRKMITDNPSILMAIESYKNNFHARINKLKTKTLIVWGRDDTVFGYENGLFLKENIENSVLYVIDGATHDSLQTHANLIFKLIEKYF